MGCRTYAKHKKPVKIESVDRAGLIEKGRVQYFFHCSSSELPVRDVLRKKPKKEPHIEIGAENYWVSCYQSNNIIPFIKGDEKYLFLMTTCRSGNLRTFYGRKYIAGYIVKECKGENADGICFVKGSVKLFSFADAFALSALGYSENTRMHLVDEGDTKRILEHFRRKKNILQECVQEIKRLDRDNRTCVRVSEGKKCVFSRECLRWKQQ